MTVEYRPIPDMPGYRVGSDGTAWSERARGRVVGLTGCWRKLRGSLNEDGYRIVHLRSNGKGKKFFVGHLVLFAFVGPRPLGMEMCHQNGVRDDNGKDNLRWDTHRANIDDAGRHGNYTCGKRNSHAKLDDVEVLDIRRRAAVGEKRLCLAKEFCVNRDAIDKIVGHRRWKHLA